MVRTDLRQEELKHSQHRMVRVRCLCGGEWDCCECEKGINHCCPGSPTTAIMDWGAYGRANAPKLY